ncbi:hypothetical protein VNO80_04525 [Phaseolus coccineus]|uniref:Uncharacterized protein n=1 Tax=Phaseolus coccineus TaxID=3886 RepID=A0AAN9NY08_PHACN
MQECWHGAYKAATRVERRHLMVETAPEACVGGDGGACEQWLCVCRAQRHNEAGVQSWRGAGRDGEVRRREAQRFRGGEAQRAVVFTGAASGLGNDEEEECAEEVEEAREISEE